MTGNGAKRFEAVASHDKLAVAARERALDQYLKKNRSLGHVSRKMLAALVNAIAGAVWVDCGKDIAVVKLLKESRNGL